MTNEIGGDFMYFSTVKEIWDAAQETYSNVDNISAIFEIKSFIHDLRQVILHLQNILTPSLDIGSSWTFMRRSSGVVQKIVCNIKPLWRRNEFINSSLDSITTLMRFVDGFLGRNLSQRSEKSSLRLEKKKTEGR